MLLSDFIPATKQRQFETADIGEIILEDEPLIVSVIGSRGGGKSGISDEMLTKYHKKKFTCAHLYSGRSLENLYPVINKNCDLHFKKIKQLIRNKFGREGKKAPRLRPNEEEKYLILAERGGFIKKTDEGFRCTKKGKDLVNNKLLHCKCHKAVPILLLVPEYIEFDEETIHRFNEWYWKNLEEYKQHMSDISHEDIQLLKEKKLLKPSWLRPKPLFKVVQFPIPNTVPRQERFRKIWTESLLECREEGRIAVMSPLFFEGQDKFDTLADIARYHPTLMNLSGHFEILTEKEVGKPFKYWTNKQKNHHKMAIFIDEARSVIPSSKMHGEKGAGTSKKEIFDKVPEMRHFKTWLHFFYQNPMDVYDGVRHNDSMTIMKRTHLGLAGDYWKGIFERITRDRWNFMKKLAPEINKNDPERNISIIKQRLSLYEKIHPEIKKYIDKRRPYIEELESDKAYVFRFGKMKKIDNQMGSWHHKQESESFTGDTGIKWIVNREKRPVEQPKSKAEAKKESVTKKENDKKAFAEMRTRKEVENKNWTEILDDMIELEAKGEVTGFDFKKMKDSGDGNKKISDKYRGLKKRFETISA